MASCDLAAKVQNAEDPGPAELEARMLRRNLGMLSKKARKAFRGIQRAWLLQVSPVGYFLLHNVAPNNTTAKNKHGMESITNRI